MAFESLRLLKNRGVWCTRSKGYLYLTCTLFTDTRVSGLYCPSPTHLTPRHRLIGQLCVVRGTVDLGFFKVLIHILLSRLHTEGFIKDQFLLSSPHCWSFKSTEKLIWSNHFHTLLLPSVIRPLEQYTAWVTQSHHWYQQCPQRLMKDIKFLISISPVYIKV